MEETRAAGVKAVEILYRVAAEIKGQTMVVATKAVGNIMLV